MIKNSLGWYDDYLFCLFSKTGMFYFTFYHNQQLNRWYIVKNISLYHGFQKLNWRAFLNNVTHAHARVRSREWTYLYDDDWSLIGISAYISAHSFVWHTTFQINWFPQYCFIISTVSTWNWSFLWKK